MDLGWDGLGREASCNLPPPSTSPAAHTLQVDLVFMCHLEQVLPDRRRYRVVFSLLVDVRHANAAGGRGKGEQSAGLAAEPPLPPTHTVQQRGLRPWNIAQPKQLCKGTSALLGGPLTPLSGSRFPRRRGGGFVVRGTARADLAGCRARSRRVPRLTRKQEPARLQRCHAVPEHVVTVSVCCCCRCAARA